MSNILEQILTTKRQEVAQRSALVPQQQLMDSLADAHTPLGFVSALQQRARERRPGVIAEIKKASPSKGVIRADFNPAVIASSYAAANATCLSVLTDRNWFQGAAEFLIAARAAVSLPVLRKDFMIDPLQIVESRVLGADCILLIMAALDDATAAELESCAFEYGMDVLIECHDDAEIERAKKLKSPLIGINNRNLKTMEISLDVGEAMLPHLPADRIAVAESGLFHPADLARMARSGARCFLIGESLMRADDVVAATATILANPVGATAQAG